MNDAINNLVIRKIMGSMPKNFNPVDYISGILQISSKSVYRRIKGEIPFTVTETIKLARELKFSIDEIVHNKPSGKIDFVLQADNPDSPLESFHSFLLDFFDFNVKLYNVNSGMSYLALNHIPLEYCVFWDNMFRFYYFNWMHRNSKSRFKQRYSEIIIPADIISMKEQIRDLFLNGKVATKNFQNTTMLAADYINPFIMEVQHYYRVNLLDEAEMELIKQDLYTMLDFMEVQLYEGSVQAGAPLDSYILDQSLNVSSRFVRYDNSTTSHIMIFGMNTIQINNSEYFSKIHMRWFESMKKYGALITRSNEVLQARFLKTQRDYIDRMTSV